jgi:hypothetical protein
MRIYYFLSLLLCTGCLYDNTLGTESSAQVNVYNLQQLQIGMNEEEVFQIMKFPTRDEQIILEDGCYDIWFYITRGTALDQPKPLHRNLTPLIFKDGIYVGKGYDRYQKLRNTHVTQEKTKAREQRTIPELENIPLEKTLTPPDSSAKSTKTSFLQLIKNENLAMSSRPKAATPASSVDQEDMNEDVQQGYDYDESDEKMMEEQQEENFNNW